MAANSNRQHRQATWSQSVKSETSKLLRLTAVVGSTLVVSLFATLLFKRPGQLSAAGAH
jgi:hypothetical protein